MSVLPTTGGWRRLGGPGLRGSERTQGLSAGLGFESLLQFCNVRPSASDFTISRPQILHLSCGNSNPFSGRIIVWDGFSTSLQWPMEPGPHLCQLTSSPSTPLLVYSDPAALASAPHICTGPLHLLCPLSSSLPTAFLLPFL